MDALTVPWAETRIGRSHYFATACGHRHRTASAAATCRNRGYDMTTRGPWPVIEVLMRPGRITRTRTITEAEARS